MEMQNKSWNKYVNHYKSYGNNSSSERCLKIIHNLKPNSKILSLGCGSGREVKELVKHGHKITAVDINKEMIKESRETNSKIVHHCEDAIKFLEENKEKYDYILGLYSLLNYIPRKHRKRFNYNVRRSLRNEGLAIFDVRMWNDDIRTILKLIYFWFRGSQFGDFINKNGIWSHNYTRRELDFFKVTDAKGGDILIKYGV